MTSHAQWRLQLARQIAPVFAEFAAVRAAIVGGSVARCDWGWSNRIEFYAEREDLFFFYGCLRHRIEGMAGIVLALNGVAVEPGAPLLPQVAGVALAPEDFSVRVGSLLRAAPVGLLV